MMVTKGIVTDVQADEPRATNGGPFGSKLTSKDYSSEGIPVIRGGNLGHGKFIGGEFAYVSKEKFERDLSKNTARPGDLIFTQRGTLGQVAILGEIGFPEFVISQSQMKLTLDKSKADLDYMYYYFTGPEQQAHIRNSAIQTGVPHTNLGILRNTPIQLPALRVQQKVASVLSALDTKIELTLEINCTLEDLAQALYRHWFVDFGPFQDGEFVESELGMIPEGWSVGSMSSLFGEKSAAVKTGPFGSNLHASDYEEVGVPLLLVKNVLDGEVIEKGMPKVGDNKAKELDAYRLKEGDIVVTRVGFVGRSAYIFSNYSGWLFSGQTLRIRSLDPTLLNSRYLAQAMLHPNFISLIEAHSVGSTRPSLNTKILSNLKFIIPPIEVQNSFCSLLLPEDELKLNLRDEIKSLTGVRDFLLPRLLSGKITIGDAA